MTSSLCKRVHHIASESTYLIYFTGYVRFILFVWGIWRALDDDYVAAASLYSVHWALDTADGIVARKYNQCKYQPYLNDKQLCKTMKLYSSQPKYRNIDLSIFSTLCSFNFWISRGLVWFGLAIVLLIVWPRIYSVLSIRN